MKKTPVATSFVRRLDAIKSADKVDYVARLFSGGEPGRARYFIRAGEVDDTFRVAELLVDDPHELVQKATGSWLREAGKRDPKRLVRFLEQHAATMPRTTLRYAVEKLNKTLRAAFMNRAKA